MLFYSLMLKIIIKITFRVATVLFFLLYNSTLYTKTLIPQDLSLIENQNLHLIGMRCVKILKKKGRDILLNKCNSCRSVSLTRRRSGIPTPVIRRYTIPAKAQFPIPFRGPGQTRLSNDTACKSSHPKKPSTSNQGLNSFPKPQVKCSILKRISSGVIFLVNSCKTCKIAVVQRFHANGYPLSQELLKLNSLESAVIKPKGGSRVKVIHEAKC